MFKQITNVRPSKSEVSEVMTTPTKGNIKLNSLAAKAMNMNAEDYAAVFENEGVFYLTKGTAGDKENKIDQVGAILASTTGKNGGNLVFSSENAYRNLGGNAETKKIYSVGEAFNYEGKDYFPLTFSREEVKAARKEKESAE